MKLARNKITKLALGGLLLIVGQAQAMTFGFSDISVANMIGTGANTSGLVIDFNDGSGTERHVFGYQWDGSVGDVSGAEMFDAVATAIPDLSFVLGGGTIADGGYLNTISYDTQSETSGDFVSNFDYWGYFIAGGTAGDDMPGVAGGSPVAIAGAGTTIPTTLNGAPVGFSATGFGDLGRFIEDGSWDVWSIGPFEATYVVPEPSNFALLAGLLSILVMVRRRSSE